MKRLLTAVCALSFCALSVRAESPADLIVTGDIFTVDGPRTWAKAMAVRDGKIAYVGPEAGAEKYRGEKTKTIALKPGQMVLPGFHDCHVHLMDGAMVQLQCQLDTAKSREETLEMIKAYVKANPAAPWILGFGWQPPFFPEGGPNKADLDAIEPNRPVLLFSQDGHSSWANSAALKLGGIDKTTKDPERGRIERDPATGEPSGALREAASEPIDKLAPRPTDEEWIEAYQRTQKFANSLGITSIQEALITPRMLEVYHKMAEAKQLNLKVVAALATDPGKPDSQVEELVALRNKYAADRLVPSSAKIFEDGCIEYHTAAMLTPYSDDAKQKGILNWDKERLTSFAKALDKAGFQIHVHAIGDQAVRVALDALEAAKKENGDLNNRHQIAHLELIAPEDIPRFRELGIIANFQPFWCFSDHWIKESTTPLIGTERADRLYQIESVMKTGAVVCAGSDWTVSSLDPLAAIQVGMTREPLKEPYGEPWLPDERASLASLIAAYTINGAYTNHQEENTGSLEKGKAADFIVLDKNLFAIPPREIASTRVLRTFVDGEEVFKATLDTLKLEKPEPAKKGPAE